MRLWRQDPELFLRETYESGPDGQQLLVDSAQIQILNAVRDYDRVAVRTARGVGKTAAAAGLIIPWFLATHYPARVVTAAGTWNHLAEKLWPEIRVWSRGWILKDAWEYQELGMYHRDDPDAWRVVAETSNRAENVEGHHSPNLLILVDEAKGMADEIFAALLASLTSAGKGMVQKIVALSTPPLSGAGWFARVSTSTDWKVVHVSGLDSPRVSKSYVEEIARDYGTDSPEYQSYVLGDIPEGSSEAVVQIRHFCNAQELVQNPDDLRPAVVCCDVAREGDDLTTIGVIDKAKWSLVKFEDGKWGWFHGQDTMATADRLTQAVKLHRARQCVLDAGAMGGGVVDRLRVLQRDGRFPKWCLIVPVMFGGSPRQEARFRYRKDELWWTTREALRGEWIALPTDEEIQAWQCPRGSDVKIQVTSALYRYLVDKIVVMDKRVSGDEKTKTLPTKSPDMAHSLILGVDYYLRGIPTDVVLPPPETGEEALGRVLKDEVNRLLHPRPTNVFRRLR